MTRGEIQAELAALEKRAYINQPDMTGVVFGLLELLACAYCDHEPETKTQPGGEHGPAETFIVCRKCGYEPQN